MHTILWQSCQGISQSKTLKNFYCPLNNPITIHREERGDKIPLEKDGLQVAFPGLPLFSGEHFVATNPTTSAPRLKKRKLSSSKIFPSVDTSSFTCLVKLAYPVQEPGQDLLHWKKITDTEKVKVVFLIISYYWVLTINQAVHQKLLGLFKFLIMILESRDFSRQYTEEETSP